MSICNPCTKLKDITFCTDSIIIGRAPLSDTNYVVYFKRLADGVLYNYHVTSNVNNILILDFIDGIPFADGLLYEFWINQENDSINTQLDLLIGEINPIEFTIGSNGTLKFVFTNGNGSIDITTLFDVTGLITAADLQTAINLVLTKDWTFTILTYNGITGIGTANIITPSGPQYDGTISFVDGTSTGSIMTGNIAIIGGRTSGTGVLAKCFQLQGQKVFNIYENINENYVSQTLEKE